MIGKRINGKSFDTFGHDRICRKSNSEARTTWDPEMQVPIFQIVPQFKRRFLAFIRFLDYFLAVDPEPVSRTIRVEHDGTVRHKIAWI